MDNSIYAALSRQSGLMREMQVVANNMANITTTGFRREGVVFAEYVDSLDGQEPSLSMAYAHGKLVDFEQGPLANTGSSLDFAIEGEGFFMIETPEGNQLTRAGSFMRSPAGELVTPEGFRVLDNGGSAIFIPADQGEIAMAEDGTMSVNGAPLAQIGLYLPENSTTISLQAGTRFAVPDGTLEAENARVLQGFVEQSNVDPVKEIARMIEVQRAYEMGQNFLDREDERIRSVISTLK
ncbi:flagellar basal-body rod protein FlgF [Rhodobacter aestuarii]|uniref:Flagellar basal-body rod protein FlgF n=1 Tax=Rhodobacter aestuarii TaxID=453582 RepID=A0A1N7LLN9_9RHOB|nr:MULTISPECIES: flagellar hook-basal body complex protein [Rhodobacter]PTV95172.1 flagellar basal-body rod protein FlgF [Rhodobacter aestuarii]SIS74736.1 flagellar basal-body rod protein FlgF [Rhodobacter aestuarii]SOC07646.1 flagellar basal-body rod protein FlgF [Rhodobacter sp. JA431]